MEKIKTAIILPYFGTGGAEKMVAQLAAGLDRDEFDAEVFCIYGEPQNNHLEQMVRDKGVPIHFIGKKKGFSLSAMVRLFRQLNAFKPDVVHTHLYACLYAFPWPLVRRKPFLHTFHAHPNLENRRFLRRIISACLIRLKVMAPVSISHRNRNFLSSYYGISETRIPVVHNPVEISRFHSVNHKTAGDFTFITAGRFSAEKNQQMMLRAFAAFLEKGYDARLILLGKGEEEAKLKSLAQKLGVSDRIDFAGFVVNVEEYLANADVFLLSSDFEALPLALLEAMAAGLPIVATDVGGIRDIVTDNGILIPRGNPEDMARAMEELYRNQALYERMAAAAGNNVRGYDLSNTVAGYSELYRCWAGDRTR